MSMLTSSAPDWLIEAIGKRHLVLYTFESHWVLVEPHAFVRTRDNRDVVLAREPLSNRGYYATPGQWRFLRLDALSAINRPRRFESGLQIPLEYASRIAAVHLQAK